jgi:hypothetical protein
VARKKATFSRPTRDILKEREKAFIDAYLQSGGNQAKAALAYDPDSKCPRSAGYELLHHNKAIRAFFARKMKQHNITVDRFIVELESLAFSNLKDFEDENGELIPDLKGVSREQAASVAEIIIDQAGGGQGDGVRAPVMRTKFKFHDKLPALAMVGKMLKVVSDSPPPSTLALSGTLKVEFVRPPDHIGAATIDVQPLQIAE